MLKRSKRIFVMPDTHFEPEGMSANGGHDEAALATCLKAIEIVRPDEFIHLGDLNEHDSCSAWKFKSGARKRPPLDFILRQLDREFEWGNFMLDTIDGVLDAAGCKKRTLIEGNHETRVRRMLAESELALEKYYVPKQLNLRERGWAFSPYGRFVQRGHVRFYHGGHYSTVHHAYQTALKCGASIVYGDRHDVQAVTVPSIEGPRGGFCMGCLCKLDKEFLEGRKVNWQHAFGVVYVRPNGHFNVAVHRIEQGWAIVEGREIQDGKILPGRPRKEVS